MDGPVGSAILRKSSIIDGHYKSTINTKEIDMATGYCVKCKEKGVELSAPEVVKNKTGGFMAKGKHEKCGTTVCAMMSKENAEKAVKDGATKAY